MNYMNHYKVQIDVFYRPAPKYLPTGCPRYTVSNKLDSFHSVVYTLHIVKSIELSNILLIGNRKGNHNHVQCVQNFQLFI